MLGQTIAKDVDVLAAFFDDQALLRSPGHAETLVTILTGLRACNFSLSWDNPKLDPEELDESPASPTSPVRRHSTVPAAATTAAGSASSLAASVVGAVTTAIDGVVHRVHALTSPKVSPPPFSPRSPCFELTSALWLATSVVAAVLAGTGVDVAVVEVVVQR